MGKHQYSDKCLDLHIDYKWIISKHNGNSGGYLSKGKYSRAVIQWIYGKNWFQIKYYNLILLIKYMKRLL